MLLKRILRGTRCSVLSCNCFDEGERLSDLKPAPGSPGIPRSRRRQLKREGGKLAQFRCSNPMCGHVELGGTSSVRTVNVSETGKEYVARINRRCTICGAHMQKYNWEGKKK